MFDNFYSCVCPSLATACATDWPGNEASLSRYAQSNRIAITPPTRLRWVQFHWADPCRPFQAFCDFSNVTTPKTAIDGLHQRRAEPGDGRVLPARLTDGLASPRLAGLDGLRVVAAFLVVFAHAGFERVLAGAGVLAFFVLSGFLITRLMIAEDARAGRVSISQFYLRRSFRIFPAFYAYFVLVAVVKVVKHAPLHLAQTISAFFTSITTIKHFSVTQTRA